MTLLIHWLFEPKPPPACPCFRHRQKGRWPDAIQGNRSIASAREKLPLNYSVSHCPVHGPLTAAGKAAAGCHAGTDAAGFTGKEKSREGGSISGTMPRRAEHVGKPRTALLCSRWERGKREGRSSQLPPPLGAAVNVCVTVVCGSQHSPPRLFAP